MIEFDYRRTDPAVLPGWEHSHDVATADRSDLLWSGFPGDISVGSGADLLSTGFGWVPLLHFAFSIVRIADELSQQPGGRVRYLFTESADELWFDSGRELVRISASFAPIVVSTSITDLSGATRRFAGRLVDALAVDHPGLPRNPAIVEFRSRLSAEAASRAE